MHLTGGQFKGRIVSTPFGQNTEVKPTLSKVRESVFNMLYSEFGDFSDLSFLDMFTGSGIMALEAKSRNFKTVTAVEFNPKVFLDVKKTFKNFNTDIVLFKGDSVKVIKKLPNFDVIYIDPPWQYDYTEIVEEALCRLTQNGIAIVEYDKKKVKSPYRFMGTEILPFKEKIYGRCMIDFLKKQTN